MQFDFIDAVGLDAEQEWRTENGCGKARHRRQNMTHAHEFRAPISTKDFRIYIGISFEFINEMELLFAAFRP